MRHAGKDFSQVEVFASIRSDKLVTRFELYRSSHRRFSLDPAVAQALDEKVHDYIAKYYATYAAHKEKWVALHVSIRSDGFFGIETDNEDPDHFDRAKAVKDGKRH